MSSASPLGPKPSVPNSAANANTSPPLSPTDATASTVAQNKLKDLQAVNHQLSPPPPPLLSAVPAVPLLLGNKLPSGQASKMLLPGVALFYEKAEDLEMVDARIVQDWQDMEAAAVSLKHLRENPAAVTTKCLAVLEETEHLFTDQEALKERVTAHVNQLVASATDDAQLRDIGLDPERLRSGNYDQAALAQIKETAIDKMSNNLANYCYHTINHANEMFYDSFVQLTLRGHPEHLCLEGATNDFLHDLIQGLGGFTSLGQNENITAKLVSSIVQEIGQNEGLGDQVIRASQDLTKATIVGGTLLVVTQRGENTEKRALTHVVDERHFLNDSSKGTAADRQFVFDARDVSAIDDIDRTTQIYEPVVPPAGATPITRVIFEERNRAVNNSKEAINTKCPQLVALSNNATASRVFQSIRMSGELRYRWADNLPSRTMILNYFNNPRELPVAMGNAIKNFISTINWNNEVTFANQSGQAAFGTFISSDPFKAFVTALKPDDQAALFKLALTDGQAGHHMNNPSLVIRNVI